MKVSYNWLKEYLNLDNVPHDDLFKLISFHIVEIEEYKKLIEATNLMIGYVEDCQEHPNSDHLHVCQVRLKDKTSQIVCGAPNIAQGQKVIVALPGAVLPGDFKIKESKIRGVESNGMICSLQELGLDEKYVPLAYKDGIYVLDDAAPIGENPLEYLGLDDYVIDLELTSNRSDLLSMEGVAFDLGAVLNQKPVIKLPQVVEVTDKNPVSVGIETKKCFSYYTRYIKNVKIKESPWWLKSRLISCGVRPINNVVDITNYVLMELGQPLHAFDAHKLGNQIIVREAHENEIITTLDEQERKLSTGDIVITDGEKPLCVAGVMGGLSTEVTQETTDVILESAHFDALSIRATSSRLQLKSESSTRFERKIDPNRVLRALDKAASLLTEIAGGEVLTGINGLKTTAIEPKVVSITTSKINKVLGTALSKEEVTDIFKRLQYDFVETQDIFKINIPTRRMDLEESYQDIVEDVARIYGYNNIPTILPKTNDKGELTESQKCIRNIRRILSSMGLNETITYSLINKKNLYDFTLEELPYIDLLMPMSEDKAVMRQSLLNGIIEVIKYNKARKITDFALFEIGRKYVVNQEILLLSGAFSGIYTENKWQGYKKPVDFYVVKGILNTLFAMLNVNVVYEPMTAANTNYHPGRSAIIKIEDQVIGLIAALHPRYTKENDLDDTYVFEINLDSILKLNKKEFTYESLCKFPTVTRDLAIVIKKDVLAQDVLNVVKQTAKKALIDVQVFDVYAGKNLAEDEKSLAFSMIFQDREKTLEAGDVDKVIKSILNRLEYHFQAKLR